MSGAYLCPLGAIGWGFAIKVQLMNNLKMSLTDPDLVGQSITMLGSSAQARRHLLSVKSYRLISDMAQLRRDIAAETLMALDMAADLHLGGVRLGLRAMGVRLGDNKKGLLKMKSL